MNHFLYLMILTLLSSWPLFDPGTFPEGDDFYFHLSRIEYITMTLKAGYFPPRILLGWLLNYGVGSEFYYPELLRRFQAADTTLNLNQLRHFYYGTATRSEYDPYKMAKIDALREAFEKDTPSKEDWEKAANEIDKELETDPTNIRFHLYKYIIYSNLYGPESEKTFDAHNQVVMLLSAVTSTGDGSSKEKAFHVISVADEYGILEIFGLSPTMQSLVEDKGQSYDVMDLQENKYGLKSMYFNITASMAAMNKMFGF